MRVWAFYAYVCNKRCFLYVGQATNGLSWARNASELGSRGLSLRKIIGPSGLQLGPLHTILCSEVKEWIMDLRTPERPRREDMVPC